MKPIISKQALLSLSLLLLGMMLISSPASATGPRVTKALFAIDKSEIHTLDFPPYLSSEMVDGGPISEIVNKALQHAGIDAVISTHPVQRMVKYYLLQENALAIMGRHLNLSSETRKDLIYIPVAVMTEMFYYYKPRYPNGLSWSGKLESLKGKTYGAHKGEDASAYQHAGIAVKQARTIKLLKMIASGEVDFAAIPPLTGNWLLSKYMTADKENFAVMQRPAQNEVFYIIFNRKHADGEGMAERIRKALMKMVDDGSYAEIVKKHLGAGEVINLHMGDLKERLGIKVK